MNRLPLLAVPILFAGCVIVPPSPRHSAGPGPSTTVAPAPVVMQPAPQVVMVQPTAPQFVPPPEPHGPLAPEVVIFRAYHDYCGREPDAVELRLYRRRMLDEGWQAEQVRRSIAQNRDRDRHRDRSGYRQPAHRYPDGRVELTPDEIIDRAYDDLLERKPDAAGRDRYRRLLRQGQTEAQVRAAIRQSVEYRVTLPDSKTTRAYREVLGRDPDASGMESYRRKIVDNGWTEEDVKENLRQSAEYRNRHR